MNAPEPVAAGEALSEDRFLGGRIVLRQPLGGLRAGTDALMLAAAVPARPGDRLFEAGIGTGAAALSLLARVAGTRVTGIEIDAGHAALARANAALNGLSGRLRVIETDIAAATVERLRAEGEEPGFAHAFANPPFHDETRGRAPRSPSRRAARTGPPGALATWVARLADQAAGGGTVTVIHRAEALPELLAAFGRVLGGIAVLPLAPREGEDGTRVIVQARKGARARPRLMAPLVLHHADGAYTDEAEAVLRHGAALDLAGSPVAVKPMGTG